MSYEEQMDLLQDLVQHTKDEEEIEALEAAIDSMAFLQALHQSLADNGARLSQEPDTDEVGAVLDNIFGEISAACLFLSEPSFQRVPDMLRSIAKALEDQNVPWTDPQGTTEPPVPAVVIRGFKHFAARLDATKLQKQHIINELKKIDG